MTRVEGVAIMISPDASAPTFKAVRESSGFPLCLYARLPQASLIVAPLARVAVPAGVALVLPDFIEAQVVAPRGWSHEQPFAVINSPGTIDPDYRGEIHVILINLSDRDAIIANGQEIAELKLASFVRVTLVEVNSLELTTRGESGLGSTGSS
jgi:dUTP pyrophosphatase